MSGKDKIMAKSKVTSHEIRVTPTNTPTDDPALAERQRIVDQAVRHARRSGYCDTFDEIMKALMPEMVDPETDRVTDSDGRTCRQSEWRDAQGYDRHGFDSNGYDRDGYNRDGFDREGFNRDGVDSDGFSKDDPARFSFNADRLTLAQAEEAALAKVRSRAYVYDRHGFDSEGFGQGGYHRTTGEYRQSKDAYYTQERG